ncbi:MAG: isoprenylcysteine carboxylmethyltransferase family protein [Methylomarinum sp.]|nr:isoprenylcysteine carboxylmethyltransferase family protein [Methylomarinum sp.]
MKLLFIKTILFSLLVPGVVAVLGPWLIIDDIILESVPSALLALLLMAVGSAIYIWCVWDFISFGKGTPAPIDAPKYLVIRGLYQYTRNPMYLGVLCFIFGWVLLYTEQALLIYCVCVASTLHLLVIFYEEPILRKQFGSEYIAYSATVNRWLPNRILTPKNHM